MPARGLEILKPWKRLVESIPYAPGVYCVWNGKTPLYIGTSTVMSDRLLTHTHRDRFIEMGANAITFIATKTPEGWPEERVRRSIENWLIKYHRPVLNKQPRWWSLSKSIGEPASNAVQ